ASLPNEAEDVSNRGLIRPPLVHLTSLIVGALVQLAAPLPFLPLRLAAPLGVSLVVIAIALFWFSVAKFRAAGTLAPWNKPSTTFVGAADAKLARVLVKNMDGITSPARRQKSRRR